MAARVDADPDQLWSHAVLGALRDGTVRVELRRRVPEARLEVFVSPSGMQPHPFQRTRAGDLLFGAASGLNPNQVAKLATGFAQRLDAMPAILLERFPHLMLARGKTGTREAALELWQRMHGGNVPARRSTLRLDAEGLSAFLEPELGQVLAGRPLRFVSSDSEGCTVVLGDDCPVRIGPRSDVTRGFGATGAVVVEPRTALDPDQARACSFLALLVLLNQDDGFAIEESEPASSLATSVVRYSIEASSYALLRQVVSAAELEALRTSADRAIAAVRAAVASGRELAYTFYDRDVYVGTRCLYCWGQACERLLAHEWIHGIAGSVLGRYRLFDMTAHSALPAARYGPQRTERWHRDIDVIDPAQHEVRYLWFMLCLDDFTADNGATWVVPGSHRMPSARNLPSEMPIERYPTRTQLIAQAGDVIVLNPNALHTVGHNGTDRPRRMINVGVCRADVRPLFDHWAVAGPTIHARADERMKTMLGAEREGPLDTSWSVLPEGWQTGAPEPSGARVFSEEQRESFQPATLTRRVD